MALLQSKGYWEDLVNCGGSREYILSMSESDVPFERMDSHDKRTLQSELNEHSSSKKKGRKDVRSSLSSINTGTNMIRSMSAFTDTGH